jgi:hypothetical protein
MTTPEQDTQRTIAACKAIIDGRHSIDQMGEIMRTLEQVVAAILILSMRDARKAAAMLNEGLVPGVEYRLTLHPLRIEQ